MKNIYTDKCKKIIMSVHHSLCIFMHILTSLSVDAIFLPWYVNWTTNFPFIQEKAQSCLKHRNSVLYRSQWCLLQILLLGSDLSEHICVKCLNICIVCICNNFCHDIFSYF